MLHAILDISRELSIWLIIGAMVAGALHVLLPPGWLQARMQGKAGVVRAVLFGVPLPLCSCGVIPTGIGLKRDGASDGSSLAFLISTPQTGLDSVMVSGAMLGWPFAIFKLVSASILGLVGGYLGEIGPPSESLDPSSVSKSGNERSLKEALLHAVDVIRSVWRWLVFGVLASAAIQTWVPPEAFATTATAGETWSVLAVLLVSVPLYVCATASVPIAAALVASGMPASAALVFLIAGPATNTATVGAVYRTFGARKLAIYLVTIIVGSVVFGFLCDAVIPAPELIVAETHEHAGLLPTLAAAVLGALTLRFAYEDVQRWIKDRQPAAAGAQLFTVEGMTCNGCVSKAEAALLAVEGVTTAQVFLARGQAQVSGTFTNADITAAMDDAGFSASRAENTEAPL